MCRRSAESPQHPVPAPTRSLASARTASKLDFFGRFRRSPCVSRRRPAFLGIWNSTPNYLTAVFQNVSAPGAYLTQYQFRPHRMAGNDFILGLQPPSTPSAPAITSAQQHHIYGGHGREFHGHDHRHTGPRLTEGERCQWGDVQGPREGTATSERNSGAGTGGVTTHVTANNGVGTAASQSFTLTVNTVQIAPAITSAAARRWSWARRGVSRSTRQGSQPRQ